MNVNEKIAQTQLIIQDTAKLIEATKYEIRLLSGKIPKLTTDGEYKHAETVADRLLELIHDLRIQNHKLNFYKDELYALYHDPKANVDIETAIKINAEDSVYYD